MSILSSADRKINTTKNNSPYYTELLPDLVKGSMAHQCQGLTVHWQVQHHLTSGCCSLFSQSLQTKLPITAAPRDQLCHRQQKQKNYFDRDMKALPPLQADDVVRVQHDGEWHRGRVLRPHVALFSYIIKTKDGSPFRHHCGTVGGIDHRHRIVSVGGIWTCGHYVRSCRIVVADNPFLVVA